VGHEKRQFRVDIADSDPFPSIAGSLANLKSRKPATYR
jgi:hypothetical protein